MGPFCSPGSGSGFTDPIESGSNPDPDPQPCWHQYYVVIRLVQSQELATLSGAGEEEEPCPEEGLSVGGEECFKLKA